MEDVTKPHESSFRPRARIMKTLGSELISNDAVAVIELVKNAYDAEASRVLINFVGPLLPGEGRIEIFDDGLGMSLDVVRGAWMEPATAGKRQVTNSGLKSRRVLGEKGIGRFAAMRLASELELITRAQGSSREIYGIFDWTQFEDEQKYLDEVLILTEERDPELIRSDVGLDAVWPEHEVPLECPPSDQGTLLRMNFLSHAWDVQRFRLVQRGLSRLISPFKESKDFKIFLQAPDGFSEFSAEITPPSALNYPHYIVKGEVDAEGRCNLRLEVKATGETVILTGGFVRQGANGLQYLDEDAYKKTRAATQSAQTSGDDDWTRRLPVCGPLQIEIRVWDRNDLGNVVQQTKLNLQNIRADLDAFAGINIYRDGFRVLPYGEPNNDWLRLDIRRVQNPTKRLSNNQIVGHISITGDQNPGLKDQSNREGLDENQSYADLREVMKTILTKIEDLRRRSKRSTNTGNSSESSQNLFAPLDLAPIRQHLDNVSPRDEVAKELIDTVERTFNEQVEGLKAVVARYHALATLGQLIDVLLHDGRLPLAKIRKEALLAQEDIAEGRLTGKSLLEKLAARLSVIAAQSDVLATVFRRIEPFGGRKRGRPKQLYLEKIIEDAFGVCASQLAGLGVVTSLPETQTLVRVDEAEMQEVIVNLLQNSIYWLQFVSADQRKIEVSVTRTAQDCVEIIFSDTGPGISEQDRVHIFDPYFSTKKDGMGLGLAIVGEIIKDYYGGELELLDSSAKGGAAFRITLTKRV
ncbi:GHKL domain-containing protein [Luteimonas viscosa]|uniref:histidine kinase n=1 Tax=Luteimonas viscosa TaxID=1132694 RepID=A0A5D4XPY5_9GAMM|nr:ATP-binding protein [Luteimonas viscosa]TYT26184.1 GHKL domain-containing protein [Luteimonas viscosa]